LHLNGDFWQCGVYKGGTASMLAQIIFEKNVANKRLCLFDTFEGMPETDPEKDIHKRGDFSDTSLAAVRERVGHDDLVSFYPGLIPNTFHGLEESDIALAHIDVDIYKSVSECCKFIYPRLSPGGFMILDDYGLPSCPGARAAVDEYFAETVVQPLVLPTGQAVVFKSGV
jgi:O-methyltransferase